MSTDFVNQTYEINNNEILTDTNEEDLNDSPYVTGGDIKYKDNNFLLYAGIAILVIIIIYLIYSIIIKIPIAGEDYYQRKTHHYFNNVHGEEFDQDAKRVIEYGEEIKNPRPIDHFRIGEVYLINAQNPQAAQRHFAQALTQIIDNRGGFNEVPFILERIIDLRDHFVNFPEIDDLPLQEALLAHHTNVNKLVERKRAEVADDDPQYTQKIILNRQNWQSDSQNVHDTAIFTELQEQLALVEENNKLIPNIHTKDFNDVVNWLKVRYGNEPDKAAKIQRVITYLSNNYPIGSMPGHNEQDIIVAVWQRSFDPENKSRINDIRESLGDAVLDCFEGTSVVCLTGRISKIWQALAKLDKNPDIGILKSKQLIRNEIYERCAKIVDDFIGENGTASEMLKSSYQKGEKTEQVQELIACMQQQIENLRAEYTGLISEEQLSMILEECKQVL
jgi:hypothetical protein